MTINFFFLPELKIQMIFITFLLCHDKILFKHMCVNRNILFLWIPQGKTEIKLFFYCFISPKIAEYLNDQISGICVLTYSSLVIALHTIRQIGKYHELIRQLRKQQTNEQTANRPTQVEFTGWKRHPQYYNSY